MLVRKHLLSNLKNVRHLFVESSSPSYNPRVPAERRKYFMENVWNTHYLLEEEERLNEKHRTCLTTAMIYAKLNFPNVSIQFLEKCEEIEKEKEDIQRLILNSRHGNPITVEQEKKNADFFKHEKQRIEMQKKNETPESEPRARPKP